MPHEYRISLAREDVPRFNAICQATKLARDTRPELHNAKINVAVSFENPPVATYIAGDHRAGVRTLMNVVFSVTDRAVSFGVPE